ncbi:hypothetical protein LQZ19_18325 [Treponema primitia]|uniref:hypothetical protein n=1 Tax=Treponema primitia TaxID=88058 RepID=UPI00397EC589
MAKHQDKKPRAPDCLKCVYFKVTWEPAFPRSCAVFGIKSRNLPSLEVLSATGRHCPSFQPKEGF